MTRDQYEQLKPLEHSFDTAVHYGYARQSSPREWKMMVDIYNDIRGTNETPNRSCNVCALRFMQQVGKLYFEYKESLAKEFVQALEEVLEDVPEPKKVVKKPTSKANKPVGRPKKK